jgi:hypothetical protein
MSATVANQSLRDRLEEYLKDGESAGEIAERIRQSLDFIKQLQPEVRLAVRECYAKSTVAAFEIEILLVLGAAISAWLIKEKALGK